MTRNNLIERFEELSDESKYITKADKTKRGREFEILIRQLLELEQLEPRQKSFRPKGEELDGSFHYCQRFFLLEAKWYADPLPASSIYQFKGKVDGKLVGTVGVFISMSGFSNDAIDALLYGKALNVVLFDGHDFKRCIYDEYGFSNALKIKLRMATELGLPFYSLDTIKVERPLQSDTESKEDLKDLMIIVEGQGDQEMISYLASEILRRNKVERKILIRNAGGKVSMSRLASALDDFSDGHPYKYLLIADADMDADETEAILSQDLNGGMETSFIIPDPEIEIWFSEFKIYDREDLKNYARNIKVKPSSARRYLVERLDIDKLLQTDEAFKRFYSELLN